MFKKNANAAFYCTCGKLLQVHTREEIAVCGPKGMAFQKQEDGRWYCTSCGKRDIDHTWEEMRKCAPEAITQDNEEGFTYGMIDAVVVRDPSVRKARK